MFNYPFYGPHTKLLRSPYPTDLLLYVCLYIAAEMCLPIRFVVTTRTTHRSESPTVLVMECAYTFPRQHVYLSVSLLPHERYSGHRLLQFFYCNMRMDCRGNLFTFPFHCLHTNRTEFCDSYSSSTVMCLYF
jgi:hypothetical protein